MDNRLSQEVRLDTLDSINADQRLTVRAKETVGMKRKKTR